MKTKKDVQRLTGLLTCRICNFSLTAIALGSAEKRAKKLLALEHHLARDHHMTQEQIEQALKAAQGVTG